MPMAIVGGNALICRNMGISVKIRVVFMRRFSDHLMAVSHGVTIVAFRTSDHKEDHDQVEEGDSVAKLWWKTFLSSFLH